MGVELPEAVAAKSESFPQFRMGVQRVRVILRAGAVVDDVTSWSVSYRLVNI